MTFHIIPPVVEITITNNIDVMRIGDACRRVADLRGFSPIHQAMIAGATMSLAEWLCRTQKEHLLEIYGIQQEDKSGIRIECRLNWLKDRPAEPIEKAMRVKLADLIDEVEFMPGMQPVLYLTSWLTDERKVRGYSESESG